MSGCRICRVRFRNGRVLELPRLGTARETEIATHMRRNTCDLLDWWGDQMTGFCQVVWNAEGDFTAAYRFDNRAIPPHLMPAFVAEMLRDRIVAEEVAHDVIEGRR